MLLPNISSALLNLAFIRFTKFTVVLAFMMSMLTACGGGGGGGNTAPTADDGTLTTNEDTTATGTLTGSDINVADTLTYSIVTNGTVGVATITDAANGAFSYVPNADNNGTDEIIFVVNDGTVDSAEATITVTVTPVNDIPVGVNDAYTTTEGVPLVVNLASGVLANDTDVDAGDLLTAVIVGNGTDGIAVLNADGSFTYTTTSPTFSGTDSFTYVVNDAAPSASATTTVNITVTGINNVPSFTKGANETSNEDAGAVTVAGWATSINKGAPDETGQVLTFTVTNDNNALFATQPSVDPTSGDLTYTPATNANGAAVVTVTLSDDGGTLNGGVDTSASQAFSITVTAVNDAPSFTKGANETVLEDAGAQSVVGWATAISKGPADENGQAISSFNVSNDNNGLFSVQPSIANNGDLTYTLAANANGSATVTVSVTDDGGTANGGVNTSADQTFTITVTAQNDTPTASAGPDQNVNEQVVVALDGSGSGDIDVGDTLTYAWTQTAGTTVILSDASAESPSFTAPAISAGETLTFQISVDDTSGAVIDTVDINLSTAGHLAGHVDAVPQAVDLTAEGVTDWAFWGNNAGTAKDEKSGGTAIGAVAKAIGTEGNFANFSDGDVAFSWTDGTTDASDTSIEGIFTAVRSGSVTYATGHGYTVPITGVGTGEQTLRLYMGVFNAEVTVTATLGDGSATPVSVVVNNNTASGDLPTLYKVVTFNFAAASGGQTLTLDVEVNTDPGVGANVSLSAISLSGAKVAAPELTPPNGTGTDSVSVSMTTDTPNADIFFTTDGITAPTTSATRYTGPISLTSNTTVRAIGAVGGYSNSSETSVTYSVSASTGAQLQGHIEHIPTPPEVDIETEGSTDWKHLALTATNDVNIKNGGSGAIGTVSAVGASVSPGRFTDGPIAVSWTNGSPTATTTDTLTGRFYQVADLDFDAGTQGYTFSVTPGDTNAHTLRLYLGAYQSNVTVTATLNGAQTFTGSFNTINHPNAGTEHRVVDLDFTAASGTDSLVIEVKMSSKTGFADPNVTFDAATLQ